MDARIPGADAPSLATARVPRRRPQLERDELDRTAGELPAPWWMRSSQNKESADSCVVPAKRGRSSCSEEERLDGATSRIITNGAEKCPLADEPAAGGWARTTHWMRVSAGSDRGRPNHAKPRSRTTKRARREVRLPLYRGDHRSTARRFTPERRHARSASLPDGASRTPGCAVYERAVADAELHSRALRQRAVSPTCTSRVLRPGLGAALAAGGRVSSHGVDISNSLRFHGKRAGVRAGESDRIRFLHRARGAAPGLRVGPDPPRAAAAPAGSISPRNYPWAGLRTNHCGCAHIEYLRGIENPVGVKVGAPVTRDQVGAVARYSGSAADAGSGCR